MDLLLGLLQGLVLVFDQWEVRRLIEELAVFDVLIENGGSCLQTKGVVCVECRWRSVLVDVVGS